MLAATELESVFLDSAGEVLETMFFLSVEAADGGGQGAGENSVSAALEFCGEPSGRFGISVSPAAARTIAAGFLGTDEAEISEANLDEVVCELTNMICGSVLSRLHEKNLFDLQHPEVEKPGVPWHLDSQTLSRTFAIEGGTLTVRMRANEAKHPNA